jgi:hypothetical protein
LASGGSTTSGASDGVSQTGGTSANAGGFAAPAGGANPTVGQAAAVDQAFATLESTPGTAVANAGVGLQPSGPGAITAGGTTGMQATIANVANFLVSPGQAVSDLQGGVGGFLGQAGYGFAGVQPRGSPSGDLVILQQQQLQSFLAAQRQLPLVLFSNQYPGGIGTRYTDGAGDGVTDQAPRPDAAPPTARGRPELAPEAGSGSATTGPPVLGSAIAEPAFTGDGVSPAAEVVGPLFLGVGLGPVP